MLPIDFGTGDWEASGWLRPASATDSYGSFLSSSTAAWGAGARFLMMYGSGSLFPGCIGVGGFDAVSGGGAYQAAGNPLVVSSAVTINNWIRVRVNRVSGVLRLFLDEVLIGSAASTASWAFSLAGYSIWDGSNGQFNGSMTGWSFKTTGISTSPETLPAAPTGAVPYQVSVSLSDTMAAAFGDDVAHFTSAGGFGMSPSGSEQASRLQLVSGSDMRFGGVDTLSGVVNRRVGTVDVPQYARVQLLSMRDKVLARQVWSDPVTGAFSFTGVDAARRFVTLAEYPSNPDNPAASDYLRPVAGVSLKRGES